MAIFKDTLVLQTNYFAAGLWTCEKSPLPLPHVYNCNKQFYKTKRLVEVEEYVTKVNKQFYNKKLYKKLNTEQKMKFSIMDFFSKCDQIHRKQRIWPNLLKKIRNVKLHFLCSEKKIQK